MPASSSAQFNLQRQLSSFLAPTRGMPTTHGEGVRSTPVATRSRSAARSHGASCVAKYQSEMIERPARFAGMKNLIPTARSISSIGATALCQPRLDHLDGSSTNAVSSSGPKALGTTSTTPSRQISTRSTAFSMVTTSWFRLATTSIGRLVNVTLLRRSSNVVAISRVFPATRCFGRFASPTSGQ